MFRVRQLAPGFRLCTHIADLLRTRDTQNAPTAAVVGSESGASVPSTSQPGQCPVLVVSCSQSRGGSCQAVSWRNKQLDQLPAEHPQGRYTAAQGEPQYVDRF
jgi:hypothetical protein